MNLKDKLIKIRKDNNLTQEELAAKLYVSRQTVSNWENGKFYPDIETLILISNTFNVPLDDLLKNDKQLVMNIDRKIKSHKKLIIAILLLIIILVLSLCIGYRYHKTHKKVIKEIIINKIPENHTVWGISDQNVISELNINDFIDKYVDIYIYTDDFYQNKPEPIIRKAKIFNYKYRQIAVIVSDQDYYNLETHKYNNEIFYFELSK